MVHGSKKNRLYRWELALMLGVAVALLAGTRLSGEQTALAGRVVRLHVIGASDSTEDQAAKLLARDAVLELAGPWLEGVGSQEEAVEALAAHLPELARAGAEASGMEAKVSLEEDVWFPTREYTGFSLPAGRYPALRVTLGAGEGRNWWCVVFPPLCSAPEETWTETAEGLDRETLGLITGETGSYVLKFKALELWDRLLGWMEGRG